MEKYNMIIRRGASVGLMVTLLMGLAGAPAMASQSTQNQGSGMTTASMSFGGAAIIQNICQIDNTSYAWGGAKMVENMSLTNSSGINTGNEKLDALLVKMVTESTEEAVLKTGTEAGDAQTTQTTASETTASGTAAQESTEATEESDLLTAKVSVSMNIRAKATKNSSIVGSLYRGCKATILKKKGKWYKIKSGIVTGWVRQDYVLTGAKAEKYLKKINPRTAKVTCDELNIRKSATTDSDVLLKVKKGNKFMVLKKKGDWVKIQVTPGIEGWVSADYVKIKKESGCAASAHIISVYTKRAEKLEAKRKKAAEEAAAKAAAKSGTSGSESTGSSTSASASDFEVLAAICEREAGSSYAGCLAVANVVLNRVKSSSYPNTIKGVVYQSGQFCSQSTLAPYIRRGANSNAKRAARAALNGTNNIGSRKSFRSASYARGRHYANAITIGDNTFF